MTDGTDILSINQAAIGKEAVVVGSGPSSGLVNPNTLREFCKDKITIGCNDVWRVLRGLSLSCDYFVMLDRKFYEDHYQDVSRYITEHPECMPVSFFPIMGRHLRININMNWDSQICLKQERDNRFNPNAYFHGHSSGVAGIQIAMHMGCSKVYLIGHDLCVTPTRTHGFGDRHGERQNGYRQGLTMQSGYDLIKQHADEIGIDIVNISNISKLKQFRKERRF